MKKALIIVTALLATVAICAWIVEGPGGTRATGKPVAPSMAPEAPVKPYDTPGVPQDAQHQETAVEPPSAPEEPAWEEYEATAYCACAKCCGVWAENRPDGIVYTASGAVAVEGVTIAADWDVLPPGTVVYIDGLGERVVQDRGGAIKGNAVDIFFEDHNEALVFGRQTVRLYVVKEVTP